MGFHDTLKKLSLRTFTIKRKKKPENDPVGILHSDRSTFSRIALVAQTRQMDMREVLSYPLGPLPWSLSTTSGTLIKTSKSALLPLLFDDNSGSETTDNAGDGALIVDAMALLRAMKVNELPSTYGEFAALVLSRLCRFMSSYKRVDFVVDTYRQVSITNLERTSRMSAGALRQHITGSIQRLPRQFSKFLAVGENKSELLEFFFTQWQTPELMSTVPAQKELVVTSGSSCVMIKNNDASPASQPLPDLVCTHEEADTRLLLHAKHAACAGCSHVTIKTPDTDVAVLATAFCRSIASRLSLLIGAGSRLRRINVNAASNKLGQEVSSALPGFHAFTGCDTTSAFAGRGKKAAFKLLCSDKPVSVLARSAFVAVGNKFEALPAEHIATLEKYTCMLYNATQCSSVNDARYQLFCTRSLQSSQLPPCRDAFLRHCSRANYQAGVWRRCLVASPVDILSAHQDGQGWQLRSDGCLTIDWTDLPPAPRSILEFLRCGCKTGCSGGSCSCRRHALPCTDACGCRHNSPVACTNCMEELAACENEDAPLADSVDE
ncbi:uncharacterized protein LOC135829615 [Sycon ciliatum]|uniref:uncharacterized protein LOC135829615 n=1 Tax=Sycon ciliatum TaxID=27933 RepID=UPI0031F61E2C